MDDLMFEPKFIIFDDNDHIVVSFDSNSGLDLNRAAQVFRFPNNYTQLFIDVEGFNEAVNEEDSGVRTVEGAIRLKVVGERDYTFDLGVSKLVVVADGKRKKLSGEGNISDSDSIASAVKHGLADAFSQAFEQYYQVKVAQKTPVIANAGYMYPHVESYSAKDENKSFKRSVILSIVIPCLIFAVVWVFSSMKQQEPNLIYAPPSIVDSNISVPNSAQYERRSSYEDQVELTKDTLRAMGLDPGRSADLGCLAPQD